MNRSYNDQTAPLKSAHTAKSLCTLLVIMLVASVVIVPIACQQTCTTQIESHFTPDEPCTDIIINKISSAKNSVLVHAYLLTCQKIAQSLIQAHCHRIQVKILVDKHAIHAHGSQIHTLLKAGIPIFIDQIGGIAHNKIILIDRDYVITGSFNWTEHAQKKNAENIVIIKDKSTYRAFKKNWNKRLQKSRPLLHYPQKTMPYRKPNKHRSQRKAHP